jgi:predicted nucleotidyltransferase
MTTISLDVSRKLDRVSIDLLLAVDSTAAALGVTYCIIGAFARDVMLGLCFGIDTGEATRDIDFGLMMDDWAQFEELRARLVAHQGFAEHRSIPHRLAFRGERQLDIVPFGGIERKPGEIAWPPEFTTVMSTVGLRQAHSRALRITIAEGKSLPFASPPALALMKLIAWSERGSATHRKDARDLSLLLTTYLRAGNEQRLYGEHAALLDEADFDVGAAGARILGRDLANMAGRDTRVRLQEILEQGMDRSRGEPLLRDLPLRYEEAARLLNALRRGLSES